MIFTIIIHTGALVFTIKSYTGVKPLNGLAVRMVFIVGGGTAVVWNILCDGIFYLKIQCLYNYLLSKRRKEYDLLLSRNKKIKHSYTVAERENITAFRRRWEIRTVEVSTAEMQFL